MMRLVAVLVLVLVFVVGASLGYFNAQVVDFDYLFGHIEVRLVVLLVGCILASASLTLLFCGWRMLGQLAEMRRLRRRLRDAETELKNLRNLQLSP